MNTVTEDQVSEATLRKTFAAMPKKFAIHNSTVTRGNGKLKKGIAGYNAASAFSPFCVLTDLDQLECAPSLIGDWTKGFTLHPNFIFRIAVREAEAWVLADMQGFARYSGVAIKNLPKNPDSIPDPKRTLLDLIETHGKKSVREDLLPRYGHSLIGPGYNSSLVGFISNDWDPSRARVNSDSLNRFINRLEGFSQYPLQ